MAGVIPTLVSVEQLARWSEFAWSSESRVKERKIIARYSEGRQHGALLHLAQRQLGNKTESYGWLPIPVIEFGECDR